MGSEYLGLADPASSAAPTGLIRKPKDNVFHLRVLYLFAGEKRRADIDRFFTMLFSWGLRNGVPLLRMSSIQHFLLQVGDLPSPDPTEGTPKLTSLDEAALSQNDMLDAPESSPATPAESSLARGAKAAATAETAGRAVDSPGRASVSASKREMARELANESAVLEAAALGMK